ncbi:MAG: FAD-binding oxidoreductase [Solirubrobacteraceae bacterium]
MAGGDGAHALLMLGFESAAFDFGEAMARALACCADHGGERQRAGAGGGLQAATGEDDALGSWRHAFMRAPYLRDTLVAMRVLSETFESAITWERLDGFVDGVRSAVQAALREVCGAGTVTCRLTHAYPDGAAPYFTVLAPARRGAELEQWDAVKTAASDAVIAAGGTITHHHAVGRDHPRWYDRQRPEPFAAALAGAKAAVDPGWALNPGVLLDRSR